MPHTVTSRDVIRFHRQIDGLNWQFGGENMHYNFLHRSEFIPHAVVCRAGEITRLEEDPRADVADYPIDSHAGRMTLDEYVTLAPVNGVMILQHGRIVYERYPRMRPYDKHLLMSVTKAFVSTLTALLVERGQLDPLRPVDFYLPETTGSGWQSVLVQDVLDMASGIHAPEEEEGFSNPDHPYYQYEASLGWLPNTDRTLASTYQYVAGLGRKSAPGEVYEYTSVNTFILAWLVETISGLPLHEVLTSEIWSKIGAEADALLAISAYGAPAAHGGLCATLRDVARFSLLFTPAGQALIPGVRIPETVIRSIQTGGRPEIFERGLTGRAVLGRLHEEHPRHNTNQWDYVMPDGDFFKAGYGGQGLYISPGRDLVVAYFGTPFDENMQEHELEWITRQMVSGGLFSSEG